MTSFPTTGVDPYDPYGTGDMSPKVQMYSYGCVPQSLALGSKTERLAKIMSRKNFACYASSIAFRPQSEITVRHLVLWVWPYQLKTPQQNLLFSFRFFSSCIFRPSMFVALPIESRGGHEADMVPQYSYNGPAPLVKKNTNYLLTYLLTILQCNPYFAFLPYTVRLTDFQNRFNGHNAVDGRCEDEWFIKIYHYHCHCLLYYRCKPSRSCWP